MLEQTVKKILNARVYEAAIETPLEKAAFLSRRMNNTILIKREDLQPVFSFKLRGAYNKMTTLTQAQLDKGVICASAGNHAQGLAEAARLMGVKATIVMPKTTPDIKVANVRARGGKAVLHGDAFDEALEYARKLEAERGLTFIHPYDDPDIIAGQGTVAREILHQHRDGEIHAVFIPVGGGGLISGMAAYFKYLQPHIKVIGVEFEESACLAAALKAKRRVTLSQVGIFADGIAVAQIGKEPWKICKDYVDEVITVTSDEICAAVKDIFDDTRSITEPAGAVSVAGMKKYVEREDCKDKTLITVSSGANTNFDRLRYVAERAEVGEHREAILSVTIPEKPGAFKKFVSIIGKRSITEFNYRFDNPEKAHIFVGVKITSLEEREQLIGELREADHPVLDLTDN
ncbi:MAG: threonine ammonia-lyase, biosynthetic, partial [Saccharospirillum sp.]